jgi:predicted HicB family RNase H-like nuclease
MRANEPPRKEQRQQLGARVPTTTYRQLKARAALQGVTVAALVEQAIAEFLINHAD